jgi:hypothetical protein
MTSGSSLGARRDAEVLTGHLPEYGELLDLLAERPGLLVIDADPLSGCSALLGAATESVEGVAYVTCDARTCLDGVDLAMSIADAAISRLAPDAEAWWLGSAPPASTAGLKVVRLLRSMGIDANALRDGSGPGLRLLGEAVDLVVALDAEAGLVIDHLGLMLSSMTTDDARRLLGALRAVHQRHHRLDLVLVEHSGGPIGNALVDNDHPMYRAGGQLGIRRPPPKSFVRDLADMGASTDVPSGVLLPAADLARGVPALTWRIIGLMRDDDVPAAWSRLRWATDTSTARQWDLLRRVHPQAQAVVAAMGAGLRPHSVVANAKSINDALVRLRGLGMVWQPEDRRWVLSDPLLASWIRDRNPSRVLHMRHSGAAGAAST